MDGDIITYRQMKESDLDQVTLLEQDSFSCPWSRESFEDVLKYDCYRFIVAEDTSVKTSSGDALIIGYTGILATQGEADVTNVCVRKEYRRRGIATQLLKNLFTISEDMNIDTYFLEVREKNTGAIALYEGFGFEQIGIRKHYYTDPIEDAIIMTLKK